jgi:hypothetical protein
MPPNKRVEIGDFERGWASVNVGVGVNDSSYFIIGSGWCGQGRARHFRPLQWVLGGLFSPRAHNERSAVVKFCLALDGDCMAEREALRFEIQKIFASSTQ